MIAFPSLDPFFLTDFLTDLGLRTARGASLALDLSPFDLPDPLTVAYVGYWLAPIDLFATAAASFAPAHLKKRADLWIINLNLVVSGIGFIVWFKALTGQLDQRGVFLPPSTTFYDYLLGTSGLVLLLATLAYAYFHYVTGLTMDAEAWLKRWGALGGLLGILLHALNTGLH